MIEYTDIPEDLRDRMENEGTNVLVLAQPTGNDENGDPYPVCRKCISTEKAFARKGVEVTVSNTLNQQTHHEFATTALNALQAPIVVVVDDDRNVLDAWSDLRPSHIDGAVKALASGQRTVLAV